MSNANRPIWMLHPCLRLWTHVRKVRERKSYAPILQTRQWKAGVKYSENITGKLERKPPTINRKYRQNSLLVVYFIAERSLMENTPRNIVLGPWYLEYFVYLCSYKFATDLNNNFSPHSVCFEQISGKRQMITKFTLLASYRRRF